MTESQEVDVVKQAGDHTESVERARRPASPYQGDPPNPVHARVGDVVLAAARDGVRRGERPEDIIRAIVVEHKVHLSLGELHLLLASRHRPRDDAQPRYLTGAGAKSISDKV